REGEEVPSQDRPRPTGAPDDRLRTVQGRRQVRRRPPVRRTGEAQRRREESSSILRPPLSRHLVRSDRRDEKSPLPPSGIYRAGQDSSVHVGSGACPPRSAPGKEMT